MAFEKTQNKLDELRNLTWQNGKLVEALSQLSVNGLETELQQGKSNIVGAIKSKGIDASQEESMTSLADKITKIKEVEVKTLPAETSNEKANDLFNMIMKSQNWDSIYETVYENYVTNGGYVGVLMTALERGTRTSIELTGADAYYILEEDKFYTTDENRNLVTVLNGVETPLGTKNHLWDINNAQYWRHVFYLYIDGSTANGSRENVHPSAFDYCRDSNIPNIQYKSLSGNVMHFHVSNPDTCNLKWNGDTATNNRCYYFYTNVENANAQWALQNNGNVLTYVNFEALKKLTAGTLISVSRVKKLHFPNLTEVTGTLISSCNALESVDFSGLESVTGGTLISDCNALEEINLSNASVVIGGSNYKRIINNCSKIKRVFLKDGVQCSYLEFTSTSASDIIPELYVYSKEIIDNSITYPFATPQKLIFPTLNKGRIWIGSNASYANSITKNIYIACKGGKNDEIYLGAEYNTTVNYIINVEIREGARQIITIKTLTMDVDSIVNNIFKKLADNNFEDDGVTPSEPIKITIGSANLNRLTDEEKAIATDKNYILA